MRHPALAVLILATAALRPILQPHLPCSDDIGFHLLRLTQLDVLVRQGVFFSRWAPDMAQGYGYPLFNFYAPLSYYATEFISLLAGNLNLGLRLTLALGMLAAGWMMYRLAREHVQPLAAVAAAVAYMYAPYHAYDIFFRGNLAESFAWWLLPLSLWCMGRLASRGGWGWVAATAATYAAIILTHNVFALIFSPLLVAYGLWGLGTGDWGQSANAPRPSSLVRRPLSLLPLALLLGILASAFFWFPALAERPFIYSDRLLVPPIFVHWGNFLTLGELFTPPQAVRSDLLNPSPQRAVGLVQVLLALPALWLVWHGRQRHAVRFFLLATLFYGWLTLGSSRIVWDVVPLLEYVQFPWRMLGIVALTLAMLVGLGIDGLLVRHARIGQITAVLGLAALIGGNLFWMDARYCPGLENPTAADIGEYERLTDTIGTTAKGEYVPRTAVEFPPTPSSGGFASLPNTAVLHQQTRTPLELTADLTASQPFTLTAELFAYPGWVAQLNGRDVLLTPSHPYGLITLPVPAGEHTIRIFWRETTSRRVANWVSVVAMLVVVGLGLAGGLGSRGAEEQGSGGAEGKLSTPHFLLFGAIALFFTVFIPRVDTPLRRPWMGVWANLPPLATYAGGLNLVDTQYFPRRLPADAAVNAIVIWQASRPPEANYQTFVRLVDADGQVWSSGESERPRFHRPFPDPRSWPLESHAQDMHTIRPLPGTPLGEYYLELVLFDRETLAPATLTGGELTFILGQVRIERPRRPPAIAPQYPADEDWGEVRLRGYALDRTEAKVGDPFTLTLFWEADEVPTADHTVELRLRPSNSTDSPFAQAFTLASPTLLPPAWQAGDVWRGQHQLTFPAHLPSDKYTWELAFCAEGRCTASSPTLPLGPLRLTAPERLFSLPPVGQQFEERLGLVGHLAGVNLRSATQEGQITAEVELIWHAIAQTETRYKVFVQALNEAGQVVAQSDGEPAGWTRPTTSWVANEYITDNHTLTFPAAIGRITLITGLYDPLTNTRLTTPTGQNWVEIGAITVEE